MILFVAALLVTAAAMISLAAALGVALANMAAYRRALQHVRKTLAEVRAQRNEALETIELLQTPQVPVWTTGAPQEAIDAEFDDLMQNGFIADGSDR